MRQPFLKAATFFRYGNIRPAEEAARAIGRPVLRRGTQLVLDGLQRPQLALALQRQIVEERERLVAPVELLRAMAGYAPTLGMLGTLLGLSQMLFGVGSSDVAGMGASMGFAMTTTVYGLVLANLIFKPLASKVEQRNRRDLTQSIVDLQAVMLLYERQHPEYIRDVIGNACTRMPCGRLNSRAPRARAERATRHVATPPTTPTRRTRCSTSVGTRRTAKTTGSSRTPIS